MKNLRKDNKGFSLVELIVVVLIMAIIAVALAPQILKWVNNSRISSDNNTMQQVVSNFQTALTNETVYGNLVKQSTDPKVTISNSGWAWTVAATAGLEDKFKEYAGTSNLNDFKTKVKDAKIIVTINHANGKVTSTYDGGSVND